jgi:hypothetical protein
MKKLTRLAGLLSLAILAVGLMAASSASATGYLLLPVGGTVTGLSLPGSLSSGSNTIECKKDTFTATIASVHLIGPFVVKFSECTAKGKEFANCPANSEGASGGEVITNTLHGLIGLALPSNTPALLVLPTKGKVFVNLSQTTSKTNKELVCTIETAAEGNVVGLLAQTIGTTTNRALLNFVKGDPKEIDLPLGEKVTSSILVFGVPATFTTLVHLAYGQPSELMP